MRKSAALLLVVVLAASGLMMLKPACAETTPSVPEFTVTVTEKSFNITIKNQDLPDAYYRLRVKYPSDSSWWESSLTNQNNLEYTIYSFKLDEKGIARSIAPDGPNIANFPFSGKVDFQVMRSDYREVGREAAPPFNWIHAGSNSPWSDTQTYNFPLIPAPTPAPTSSPTISPTRASPLDALASFLFGLDWEKIAIVGLVVVVAVLAVGLVALWRRVAATRGSLAS